jgi:hypothetical protein
MKRLFCGLLIGGFFFLATGTQAQFRHIPGVVTDSLKAKYPNAQSVSWEDKLTSFQASFSLDNEKYKARFNSSGGWLGSQKNSKLENIPPQVKDGLSKSKYADWQILLVTTHYLPGDIVQYGMYVSKGDLQRKNLLFSSAGQLLRDGATL